LATNQFIIFSLGEERFGVQINAVQEIIKPQEVTKLPRTDDFIEGIIDLRGEVIVIVDLEKRLQIEAKEESDQRIIIVEVDGIKVGLTVDDASEVLRINEDNIRQPEGSIAGVRTEFLDGVAKVDDRLIILLDFANLFSKQQYEKLEQAAELGE
jgi:purine-binding chemotaxis protein CheW